MRENRLSILYILFVARLAFILLVGATLVEIILLITSNMGVVWSSMLRRVMLEIVFVLLIMISVGTFVSSIISKKILKPFNDLKQAIYEVSKGNFNVSVEYKHKDEFSAIVKCFNQMVIELNGIQTMRNDFINTFSHECKTPICSIRGFAKQLQRPDLTEEEKADYLEIIVSESERLTNLHENILMLCRYCNQEFLTNLEVFPLDEQIRRCILLLEKEWDKKQIELDVEIDSVDYYGNEETLSQVWINLLSNAIKFSHTGGVVKVRCQVTKSKVIVKVKDYGVGMNEETVQHMFDRFFTANLKENEGNGIGLSIVKRIVELCHGEIRVKSALGKGTEVQIHLPNNPMNQSM